MKNYCYLMVVLFISCNSNRDNKNDIINEIEVLESIAISRENLKSREFASEKIIVEKNDDEIKQIIVYNGQTLKKFSKKNSSIINEGGVYAIVTSAEIYVINTSKKTKDLQSFKFLLHYVAIHKFLDVKDIKIYLADSCTATGTDIEGVEKTKKFIFNKVLPPNVKQLVVKTENGIYIYKIDLKNQPVIFEDMEPIYRLSNYDWYSFSESPVEIIFLDEGKSFVESSETQFVDHKHSINEESLEWSSNNKKQIYSLNKIGLIEKIQDEI